MHLFLPVFCLLLSPLASSLLVAQGAAPGAPSGFPVTPAPGALPTEVPVAPPGAAGAKLTAAQSATMLKQLEELETLAKSISVKRFTAAKDAFTAAMASDKASYEFLLACHKQLDFPTAKETEFREWRDKQEGRFKTPSHMMAVRLQLQYLLLCIHAAEAKPKERPAVMTELANFVGSLTGVTAQLGRDWEALQKPVTQTVFARLYQLENELKLENWELAPGKVGDIYEKILIPWYRDNKPTHVMNAWDARIAAAEKMAVAGGEKDYEQFKEKQLPNLRWKRAREMVKTASIAQAAPQLLAIIKENPLHENAGEWITELRTLLAVVPGSASDPTAPPVMETPAAPGVPPPLTPSPGLAPPASLAPPQEPGPKRGPATFTPTPTPTPPAP